MGYRLPPPRRTAEPHPVDVGDRTEAIVIAALIRRGYRVLRPLSANQRYDLVLDLDGCFLRDVFVVHCPETDRIYAVPVGDSGVLKAVSLRVTAPANGQTKGIRWAADHELPT